STIVSHSSNRFGDPSWIAREEVVVLRSTKKANDAKLDDEVVDDLLRLLFCENSGFEIALEVNVEEGGNPTDRHRGSVLLLHCREIGKVKPLYCLLSSARRDRDVIAIGRGHLLQFFQ